MTVNISITLLTIAVIICALGLYKLNKTIETEIKPLVALLTNLSPLGKIPDLEKKHDEESIRKIFNDASSKHVKVHVVRGKDLSDLLDSDDEDED